jgi:uncharacterized protein
MDCPVCKSVQLVMSERQGIEIDYCPNCRGVWLDRGELDKIIDRSIGAAPPPPQRAPDPRYQSHGHQGAYHGHQPHYKKKREGFLSDIFDFD